MRGACKYLGCGRTEKGRGLCDGHIQQWRAGKPLARIIKHLPWAERFWIQVQKLGPDECWPWTAAINSGGYGSIKDVGKTISAHRAAWFLEHGNWPSLYVCHRCDNRRCCNPAHLFLGTHKDNMDDMRAKGRHAVGEGAHRGTLTAPDVIDIRSLHSFGASVPVLAASFGVTRKTIYVIVNREQWRHVA